MKTIEMLMDEHQIILKRIIEFKTITEENFETKNNEIEDHLDFFIDFADHYHHAKEEDILFKWMIAKNPQFEFGPIQVMLSDHNSGRAHIAGIKESLTQAREGSKEQQSSIVNHIISFGDDLTAHIGKEDNVLYMMAKQLNSSMGGAGDEEMWPIFQEANKKLKSTAEKYL